MPICAFIYVYRHEQYNKNEERDISKAFSVVDKVFQWVFQEAGLARAWDLF